MKKVLLAAVMAMGCGLASAQGYVGALVGMSKFDIDCDGAPQCDTGDTSFKLYGGYNLSPTVAIEAGYVNFGEFSASDSLMGLKLKSTAFIVGGAFRGEFSPDWTGVLRAGLASVKTTAEASLGSVSGSTSDNNAGLYAGLGIEYALTKEFKIVGAWDFTKFEVNGEDGTVHNFAVGAQYGF